MVNNLALVLFTFVIQISREKYSQGFYFSDWGQDRSLITINFEEGCHQDNYENIDDNTIDEREEVDIEDDHANDDSDSGIDSLYECIKFQNTTIRGEKEILRWYRMMNRKNSFIL